MSQTMEMKKEKVPMNGVDTPTLLATINAVKGQPELARFQFRASSRWLMGTHSRSRVESFTGAGGTHFHESDFSGSRPLGVLERILFPAVAGSPSGRVFPGRGPETAVAPGKDETSGESGAQCDADRGRDPGRAPLPDEPAGGAPGPGGALPGPRAPGRGGHRPGVPGGGPGQRGRWRSSASTRRWQRTSG